MDFRKVIENTHGHENLNNLSGASVIINVVRGGL